MKRPLSMNILIGYILVVFGISLIGSLVGAAQELAPYSTRDWLILAVPKVLALGAGVALLKMLRIGAYLWAMSICAGWLLAAVLGTGFFPTISIAATVSIVIVGVSIWIIAKNWSLLGTVRVEEAAE